MDKQNEAKEALAGVIDCTVKMILDGVLKKNIYRHFENKGVQKELIDKIVRLAEIEAQDFSHYKVGKYGKELGYAKRF